MKTYCILSFILGLIALAIAFFIYTDLQYMGFPDGYLTEFDHAEMKLLPTVMWASIAFGLFFFYLAWIALKKRSNKKPYLIAFYIITLLYIFLIITIYILDRNYYSYLDHGQGG